MTNRNPERIQHDREGIGENLPDLMSRLKAFSGASTEAMFLSEKGICLDQNLAAEKIFGYSRDEAVGRPGTDWIVSEDRETVKERMLSGSEEPYEVVALRKDGSAFPCEIQGRTTEFHGRTVRVTALRDISRRKLAELELRKSEERYRSLVENALDGYFICAMTSGRMIFLSRRARELIGYGEEEVSKLTIWGVTSPQNHQLIRDRTRARMEGRDPGLDYNLYTVVRKDGSEFQAEVSTSLVTFQGEKVIQGVLRDVTEKQRLHLQLQQTQRFEAVGTLAGGIAHDLNNLLMGIQGRASLIANEFELPPGPRKSTSRPSRST